jgi:hypothetical protein
MSETTAHLRLDRLPVFDPERQLQLVEFLGKPIDSYIPYESPRKSFGQGSVPGVQIGQRGNGLERNYEQIWGERLARIRRVQLPHRPRRGPASALQFVYPSLVQRQNRINNSDPLNRLCVEEIADRKTEVVHGPIQKLMNLPPLRCVPRDLVCGRLGGKKRLTR